MTHTPVDRLCRFLGTRPRFLALAAFLFAGDLKADPRLAWLPVDQTLLTGGLLALALGFRLLRGARLACVSGPALVCAWYATFLPGLVQAADSPYAVQKVATIFTFSLLASSAPFLLVEGERDLPLLVNAVAWFCLAIALGGLLGRAGAAEPVQRLQAFGAGTIALGRAAGQLFTVAALALVYGGHRQDGPGRFLARLLTFAVLALAGITALFSGARGPIVGALAALAAQLALGRTPLGRRLVRAGLAAGLFLAVLSSFLPFAPAGSLQRVTSFFRGRVGASETYRVNAVRAAWDLVPDAPWGIGWGRFATHVDPERGLPRQYPHNLLAEVTLESGWICGAVTVLVLAAALAAAWAGSDRPAGRLVFALLVFHVCNAMVSGDLNDNRQLFVFISSALLPRGVAS